MNNNQNVQQLQKKRSEQLQEEVQSVDFRKRQYQWIHYQGVKEINYLLDFLQRNPEIDPIALNIHSYDDQQSSKNVLNTIANKLYKKLARSGNIRKPGQVAKKLKKSSLGQGNFYNLADKFIDDAQQYDQKKEIDIQFQDFKYVSLADGLQAFYQSDLYKKKVDQITTDQIKRKGQKIQITTEQMQIMSKKLKKNIQTGGKQ